MGYTILLNGLHMLAALLNLSSHFPLTALKLARVLSFRSLNLILWKLLIDPFTDTVKSDQHMSDVHFQILCNLMCAISLLTI